MTGMIKQLLLSNVRAIKMSGSSALEICKQMKAKTINKINQNKTSINKKK
jgi:hypothetical protein